MKNPGWRTCPETARTVFTCPMVWSQSISSNTNVFY